MNSISKNGWVIGFLVACISSPAIIGYHPESGLFRQSPAQQDHSQDSISNEDETYIDSLFVDYLGERPGASVMIAKENQLLLCKGYGLADMENHKEVTCDTNFRLGSVSKQFTAMAVLCLVDQGKLTLQTKLTDIFPDFPEHGNKITVEHLLTHRSGLVDYGDLQTSADKEGRKLKDRDVLEYLKTVDSIQFQAGDRWHYSNSGYAVLATIVEKISDMPFEEFVNEAILGPLGMSRSGYDLPAKPLKDKANPYRVEQDRVSATPQNASADIRGDGSLYTSAHELFKWHKALCEQSVVSANLHKSAISPQSGENRIYGFGWFTPQDTAIRIVEHGGASRSGFIAFIVHAPEEKITVAVLSNRTFDGEETPSLNLRGRAHALLSVASRGKFPRPNPDDF